jgi:hypothetical protein
LFGKFIEFYVRVGWGEYRCAVTARYAYIDDVTEADGGGLRWVGVG